MATVIEELVARIGWQVDPTALNNFQRQVDGLVGPIKAIAKAFVGVSAAISAAVVVTNKETAQFANLADSVNLSTDAAYGLKGAIELMGRDEEVAVDLLEELNNKMGEMAGLGTMTSVTDSLRLLNLEFSELQKLAPEEQLATILDTAVALDDHQKAVSAADMLLGGEANKVIGFLRSVDLTFSEILERQKEMTFLTEEGVTGAKTFNFVFGELTSVLGSMWQQISGLIGAALTPMIKRLTDWFIANKQIIQQKVALWAEKLGAWLEIIWRAFGTIVSYAYRVIRSMGGVTNAFKYLGVALAAVGIYRFISMLGSLVTLIRTAGALGSVWGKLFSLGKAGLAIGLIALLILAIEDLYSWFKGGESVLGRLGEYISNWMHEQVQALADFFGFSKEEFDVWLVGVVDGIADFFSAIGNAIATFFDFLLAFRWSDIAEGWQIIFDGFIKWLTGVFDDAVAYLVQLPDKILDSFLSLVGDVKSELAKIPVVGAMFDGRSIGESERAMQAPTTGVIQGAMGMAQMATRLTTPASNITNQISITQQPGESQGGLARRIISEIEGQAAKAVRNTTTGIEY